MSSILIFVEKISSRSNYLFKSIIENYLGYNRISLTEDQDFFLKSELPKFSYCKEQLQNELHFYAHGLLEDKGIHEIEIRIGEFKGLTTLFHHKKEASLPFDAFSAIFYMLSRLEEYLPHKRDSYDRFVATESISFKYNFVGKPLVDHYLIEISALLKKAFPNLKFKEPQFNYTLTLDIDNAFAYAEKGFLRSSGSILRSLYKLKLKSLKEHLQVLLRFKQDPFDTFNYLKNIQKRYGLKPIYFFLLGDYGFNDKNISYQNRKFQSLIKSIADYAQVGIHPSFGSNSKEGQLHREVLRLEKIVRRDVTKSRQHFLKLDFPETYRNLVEEDITDDYTMGYANALGFRAGTSRPFKFYDLDMETELDLTVHPFCVMESTLKYYLKANPETAMVQIKAMIDEVKQVNGNFVALWHNESLGNVGEWQGWRKVFEEMHEYLNIP